MGGNEFGSELGIPSW